MGEVRLVRDRRLNRAVALKVIRPSMVYSAEAMTRFLEEAQIAAQLEHPGIVPVYDVGTLPDGRAWFTMKHVQGQTLDQVIDAVHRASMDGVWGMAPGVWTLRRLLTVFARLCEAVAYAHARGVIHRDLKPANVMIGRFGEVMVLDWGLGKVVGRGLGRGESRGGRPPPSAVGDEEEEAVRTERTELDLFQTKLGQLGGTLMYMPAEQAQGRVTELGPTVDVYALGAILFHILGNAPPYPVGSVRGLLPALAAGPPPPPGWLQRDGVGRSQRQESGLALPIPADLWEICTRALALRADQRQADAGVLAEEVNDWLEGARRQERGLRVVAEADQIRPEVARLRQRAAELRHRSEDLLRALPPLAPVARKRASWELANKAEELALRADVDEEGMVQALHGALSHQPDLAVAHQRLAAY